MKIKVVIMIALLMSVVARASTDSKASCPMVKIEAERLSDLNIPRNGHSAVCVNGEVTVFGGHTTNFVLTPTAEYYKDGEWHLMEMAYPHDNGLCLMLRSGKVLLAGGSAEPMGVGQSYPVEEYTSLDVLISTSPVMVLPKRITFRLAILLTLNSSLSLIMSRRI